MKKTVAILSIACLLLLASTIVLLNSSYIQNKLVYQLTENFNHKTGGELTIDKSDFNLLRGFSLHVVQLKDAQSNSILLAERIDMGFNLIELLNQKLEVDYLRLIRANVRLSKQSPDGDLNITPILNKLLKKSKAKWDIQMKQICFRECSLTYDVLNAPIHSNGLDANHLKFNKISALFSLSSQVGNQLRVQMKKFNCTENNGLNLSQLRMDAIVSDQRLSIRDFSLKANESILKCASMEASKKTMEKSLASWHFQPFNFTATLSPDAIGLFNQKLSTITSTLTIQANMSGSLKQLNIQEFSIINADGLFLIAHLKGSNIFENNYHALLNVDSLHIPSKVFAKVESFIKKGNPSTKILETIGTVDYSGKCLLQPRKIKVNGLISNAFGTINTDLNFEKKDKAWAFNGAIKSPQLSYTSMSVNKTISGEAALDLQINGLFSDSKHFSGYIEGQSNNIKWMKHEVDGIQIDGHFNQDQFEGNAFIQKGSGSINFQGLFVWGGVLPVYEFDLTTHAFDFADWIRDDRFKNVGFHLKTDLKGKKMDQMTGLITVDSLLIKQTADRFFVPKIEIQSKQSGVGDVISVQSNLITGQMVGTFALSNLVKAFKGVLHHFMPTLLTPNLTPSLSTNCTIQAQIASNNPIFKLLKIPIESNDQIDIQGFINDATGKFRLRGNVSNLVYGKTQIQDAGFLLENPQNEAKLIAYAQVGSNADPIKVNVDIRGKDDIASFKLNVSNQGIHTFSGNILGNLRFYKNSTGKTGIDGTLNASNMIVNDTIWNISPSKLIWENNALGIEHFQFIHDDQFIKIQGIASNKETDTIQVSLNNFSLDYIFGLLPKSNVKLGGIATGDAHITKFFGQTNLNADIQVKQFSLNKEVLGDLQATSKWDNQIKALVLDAKVYKHEIENDSTRLLALGKGYFYPSKDSMFLSLDAHHLPLAFLEPYLGDILKKIQGKASGNVRIEGPMKRLAIYTKAYIEDGSFGIDMLNTRYHFSDSLELSPTLIKFENTEVRDNEGNIAIANGTIRHNHFKNSRTSIEIIGNKILCMDLPPNPEAYFYGKAYGSGTVSINGIRNETTIDVNLKTERNTNVTISFLNDKEVFDAGFIQFEKKQPVRAQTEIIHFGKVEKTDHSDIDSEGKLTVNLQIEATPEGLLTLVTDPSTGDEIVATGEGNLRCVFSDDADIALYGRYNIQKGKYTFIYQDILRRDFSLKDDGSITFSGDPFAAQVDISAAYTVNAQLADLLPSDVLAGLNLNRTNIPVNCLLKLNGELQKPGIKLDLEYPSADDDLVRSINDVINTEDAMNQQLVFLMLFGRFSTPSLSSTQSTANNSGMSTVLNTGISTLSSQLNNVMNGVLGQANMNFNFNYKNSGYESTTPGQWGGEWGVNLGGNFFNNRLTVNSNVGSRENLIQNGGGNQFIGEFDASLKFKKSQKWSWKFFNRANDNRYFKSALNTQGAGILFKQDFNSIFDLFGTQKKKEK